MLFKDGDLILLSFCLKVLHLTLLSESLIKTFGFLIYKVIHIFKTITNGIDPRNLLSFDRTILYTINLRCELLHT